MKVDGLEKQADDISKKLRELNTSIQAANWASDLPE
jgi:chaperonin cofactor prefoldin